MEKLIHRLSWVTELNKKTAFLISLSIPVLALLLLYEIVMRYGFNSPTSWVHDMSQFIFGAGYMLGAGYTLAIDGHANMDMFYSRLGEKRRAILDIFTGLLFLFYAAILIWQCGVIAWDSVKYKEVLTQSSFEPPLYPIKIILLIGCILLAVQGLLKLLENVEKIRTLGSKENTQKKGFEKI